MKMRRQMATKVESWQHLVAPDEPKLSDFDDRRDYEAIFALRRSDQALTLLPVGMPYLRSHHLVFETR